jgi:photosystem II stability/assembly factor-like uncharacterized protein
MNRFVFALLAFLPAVACAQVTLTHVHGLAYSADGQRLMIPSHHGLAIYEGGKWSKAPGPEHDYMGFSATAKHIYSSGHPAHGSGLVNPFGLLRSHDGGRTWDKLALEGESDFHVMAASWNTNVVYVWNPAPNSRMPAAGVHYTRNDGFAWTRVNAVGLAGEPRAIAVHPDDTAIVALATSEGLFLSRDAGERFSNAAAAETLGAFFDLEGKYLWYSSYDGKAWLGRLPLAGGKAMPVSLPPLKDDAVAFIAQNPARRAEYAIATFQRDVYLSADGGKAWKQIAQRGMAK